MYKVLGSTLALLALTACPKDNPQTVTLSGGAVLYVYDSIAHGGGDAMVAVLRVSDSFARGGGGVGGVVWGYWWARGGADKKPIIFISASSTPSNGTAS